MEKQLRRCWQELLNLEVIADDDNFFALGGDSYVAIALTALARDNVMQLSVDDILANPKFCDMLRVAHICSRNGENDFGMSDASCKSENGTDLKEEISLSYGIDKALIEDTYGCTAMQTIWMRGSGDPFEHQTRMVYRLPEKVCIDTLHKAWDATAASNAILRTRIANTSEGFIQVVLKETIYWLSHDSLERYLFEDGTRPITFGDRLQRFCIIESPATAQRHLVLTSHHAGYDKQSLRVLWACVEEAYLGLAPTGSSKTFRSFIDEYCVTNSDKTLAASYWKSILVDYATAPLFTVPPAYQVSPDDELVRSAHCTKRWSLHFPPAMLIQACLGLVLARVQEANDVAYTLFRSGRQIPTKDAMTISGPTVCLVPLRLKMVPNMTMYTLLQQVRKQMIEMTPYEQRALENMAELGDRPELFTQLLIDSKQESYTVESKLDIEWLYSRSVVRLPLLFAAEYTERHIQMRAIFDRNLVAVPRIADILDQFISVLERVATLGCTNQIEDYSS